MPVSYTHLFLIIPHEFSLNAYKFILDDGRILKGLLNSIKVTLAGTAVAMALSATFAYPLSRKDFNGRATILNMVIVTMVFSGGLIPNYLLVKSLNMIDSYAALDVYKRQLPTPGREISENCKMSVSDIICISSQVKTGV